MAELESSPTTSDGEASRSEKSSCFQVAKRDLSGNRFRTPFRSRTGVFPVGEPMHRFLLFPCCRCEWLSCAMVHQCTYLTFISQKSGGSVGDQVWPFTVLEFASSVFQLVH